jgi:hypothetical protein
MLVPLSYFQYFAQVNSEFQAFKHIKITAPGEMARATKSLEATLALQPTLILTNSLPCSLDVIVWQARLHPTTLTMLTLDIVQTFHIRRS